MMHKKQLIERFDILQKMYLDLEEFIQPRLLGDFCGYNEEQQGFNIVLAIKEIIEAKEQECEKYKQALDEIKEYCKEQNLKYDVTACYILGTIHELKRIDND